MKWEVKVTNVNTRLRVRTGPGTSYRIVNWQYPSGGGVVVEARTVNGQTWYRWEGTNYWSCGITSSGTVYLKKTKDLEEKPPQPEPQPAPTPPIKETLPQSIASSINIGSSNIGTTVGNTSSSTSNLSTSYSWYEPSYKGTSFKDVDYSVQSEDFIRKEIAKIKYNMDIGYRNKNDIYDTTSKGYFSDLQKKMYNSFNRNKTAFPDKELNKTFAYVFFTRPDLNILTNTSGTNYSLHEQVCHDGKFIYLWRNNPWCLKSLVKGGNPYHKFMTFLSNEALSFEVGDQVIKTHEHGETYNGHKIVYGRSDIESNVAGEMSVRYIDTVNLDVYKLHLAWLDYISKVSRGIVTPKREYITNKILDYACSCYYFLCGPDGHTILYWQKLTGVFPINTGENVFSWDSGTLLAKPEINIKYMYAFKSAMDPIIIEEFNELISKSGNVKSSYEPRNLATGSTLSHSPKIEKDTSNINGAYNFYLVWLDN